ALAAGRTAEMRLTLHDLREVLWFEARPAHQRPVNLSLPHQLAGVLRFYAASIEDAQLARERLAEDVRNFMPVDCMRVGSHHWSRCLPRADGPAGFICNSQLGRLTD